MRTRQIQAPHNSRTHPKCPLAVVEVVEEVVAAEAAAAEEQDLHLQEEEHHLQAQVRQELLFQGQAFHSPSLQHKSTQISTSTTPPRKG